MSSLKRYEPPRIESLAITSVGKHRLHDVAPAPALDEILDARALLAKYGSPLFVLSEKMLRARYRSFLATFSAAGIDTAVAYSYKTNYLPALCAILRSEGALSEVVSGMEYELARALGAGGDEIVFNGPYKERDELERAIADGALINIDGFDELERIAQLARSMQQVAKVGIRFNFSYGSMPWTKFGFSYEGGDAVRALQRISELPSLSFEGFHNHCGTFNVDPNIYGHSAAHMIELAIRARQFGLTPSVADFGGGFPSGNTLKPDFDVPGGSHERVGGLEPYATAILNRLSVAREVFGGRPKLILEPGRALVDDAMQLICTVVGKKDLQDRGTAVIVDAGVNIVPTAYWYDHSVHAAPEPGTKNRGADKPVHIYGPLCMQIDVIKERASLPTPGIGDPLLIGNVGAYCLSQSMQFIRTRPAVVLLGENGPEVIRRRETWRDIFGLDAVPERLRHPDHDL